MFKAVDQKQSFPKLEEEMLAYWKKHNIFRRSVEERPEDDTYTFYDGPPFATGLPHYGHLLTSVIKDVIPRYQTMHGKRVERRFGWDCHGLPIENIIEKELKLGSKSAIEEYGIDKFNNQCHDVVLKFTEEWESTVTRLGRWVDFENDYKTMDRDYMESIWWVFSELWNKGLIYEGHKSLPYCYRCATPLSNFEAGLDDSYRMKQDPAVTVRFALKDQENTYMVAWTTTPWTLPGNVALAVSASVQYVKISDGSIFYILSEKAFEEQNEFFSDFVVVEEFSGKDLEGWHYKPLFSYYADKVSEGAFKVIFADHVSAEDGTGVVHIAPGFGEEDSNLALEQHLPVIVHVDDEGRHVEEVVDFAGQNVHESNKNVIEYLKTNERLVRQETVDHQYPHCWRCDTPLIYRAVSTWFVNVTKVKKKMLAANRQIEWAPKYVGKGIFHNWLEGARDWAVSRNRYWGAVIPIWRCSLCDHTEVISSVEALEKKSGETVTDLHKHHVDGLTFPCSACDDSDAIMERVPEVLDCWFESGSMPYAQLHYPFENKEQFEQAFPADFITEYVGQTRGWFYTLVVLSAALFDEPPFMNAIVHGIVLAEDGRKMSKRLKNYPDPVEVLDKYGADALRLYMMSSAVVKGDDLRFSERELVELQRKVMLTLWNTYSFFVMYANVDKWKPSSLELDPEWKPDHVLDRWILSELQLFIGGFDAYLKSYDLFRASRLLPDFMDQLSNWYVRRSRRRFWKSSNDVDKEQAYQTLWYVLVTLSRALAPLMPFLSEHLYRTLTEGLDGASDSVHLADYPVVDARFLDEELSRRMADVREAVMLGHQARDKGAIKVRIPLATVHIAGFTTDFSEEDLEVLREELNVKSIVLADDSSSLVSTTYVPNFKVLGERYGKKVQDIAKGFSSGKYEVLENGTVSVADVVLEAGEFEVRYSSSQKRYTVAGSASGVVILDTELTDALRDEGMVRDIVRAVQDLRKEAGYEVSDHIELGISFDHKRLRKGIEGEFAEYMRNELLADRIVFQECADAELVKAVEVGELSVVISLHKV